MTELTVIVREGCHLCEDMVAALRSFRHSLATPSDSVSGRHAGRRADSGGAAFELTLLDVDADDALFAQFNDKVPVLLVGEREICRYFLDLSALREALQSAP